MTLQSPYHFHHVYVEKAAWQLPQTAEVIGRLQSAPAVIDIEHYADVFNRPRQHFTVQKKSPALVLAVEREHFLYEGQERINSWAQSRLYYNALVRNCVYNCDYCFLQGMHSSAHILMFMNNGDFMEAARKQADSPIYLSISYLTDLLAFEPLFPYCSEWIDFAARHPQIGLEIRTKSDYYHAISHLKPIDNVFLVWSLSPEELSSTYERGCASFRNRLFAASRAAADGWPIKLCFDPVLDIDGWEELYPAMIRETFDRIPPSLVREVSFGVFRMNSDYLKRIQRLRRQTPVLRRGIATAARGESGVGVGAGVSPQLSTYSDGLIREIRRVFEDELSKYMSEEKIFFVHG